MSFLARAAKVWHFLWEEESIWSWLVNVGLAFLLIKFVLYPGLGFILGTQAPIVAVVSGSMEHQGSFSSFWDAPSCCNGSCASTLIQGSFYDSHNISRLTFETFPFLNGFNKGDIMILSKAHNANLGDVIVYLTSMRSDPIIHRIISISLEDNVTYFSTKGDNNCDVGFFEQKIPEDAVIGRAVWRVPYLGWVKIVAVELFYAVVR